MEWLFLIVQQSLQGNFIIKIVSMLVVLLLSNPVPLTYAEVQDQIKTTPADTSTQDQETCAGNQHIDSLPEGENHPANSTPKPLRPDDTCTINNPDESSNNPHESSNNPDESSNNPDEPSNNPDEPSNNPDEPSAKNSEDKTYLEQTFDWVITQHETWSSHIGSLGRQIDSFFADVDTETAANKSFVKIGLFGVWRKEDGLITDPRFRFRLDLPNTRKRLKFIIENEPDETLSLDESNRRNVLRKDETTDSSNSGYLRILSVFQDWQLKGDLGIRIRNPIDPFARARATRYWEFSQGWTFQLKETVSYFHSEGFGFTNVASFEKNLSDTLFFRSKTETQWLKQDTSWEFAEVLSLSQLLDEKSAVAYRLAWLGENRPAPRTSAYYVNFTYRRNLYHNWLFFELTPELLYPRDDNFKANPSLTVGVELVFSE
jgi:hypothetical protein